MDDEDDQESYFNARKDIPLIPYPDDDEEMEYDSDGNPLPPEKSKVYGLVHTQRTCTNLLVIFK